MSNSKVLGSTLIIAGTTIGAGMLALPIASAGLGFFTSLAIMVAMWALMAYTALLMLELHQHADYDATLHTLAKQFLGQGGKWVATFAMLFLFYSLCAAYIAGGGGQFNAKLHDWFSLDVSNGVGTLIFTVIIAAIVTFGTSSVDIVNRVLFTCKLIAMVIMLFFLTPNIEFGHLVNMPIEKGLIVAAIPVIFTSFGFHGSIPAVVRYLELDMKALKKVMVFGSLLPLIVYILWQLATLGVVDQATLAQASDVNSLVLTLSQVIHSSMTPEMEPSDVTSFILTFSQIIHGSMISKVVSIFADLALITSFLGVSLGLFEFLGDSLNKNKKQGGRVVIALVTFVPPLCFALFYPQGFIMALGFAAIALAILAILLPVTMVTVSRKLYQDKQGFTVAGGKPALIVTFLIGLVIISVQLLISFGVLPAIG